MGFLLRPELSLTPPAAHGALDIGELERAGLSPDSVIDFSANSNPFGPSPAVRAAIAQIPLDRYPDREHLALRRALAERLDVSPKQLVIGNGTAELIWLIAFAFLKPRSSSHVETEKAALILGPTFGEYERAIRLMAATPRHWNAPPVTGFTVNPAEITRNLDSANASTVLGKHYQLVFLCNPNNPTGQVIPPAAILAWAKAHPRTLFVVDEAYLAFVPGLESVVPFQRRNLLALRSMTKDYALAGLRLGYAVGDERLIHILQAIQPAWNVNALAQAAGLAALSDEPYYQATLTQLHDEKTFLLNGLRKLGFCPVPSQTHFFLLPVENAAQFRQSLLRQGILVRDCTSFGLPTYVRLSPRTHQENRQLLNCLQTGSDR